MSNFSSVLRPPIETFIILIFPDPDCDRCRRQRSPTGSEAEAVRDRRRSRIGRVRIPGQIVQRRQRRRRRPEERRSTVGGAAQRQQRPLGHRHRTQEQRPEEEIDLLRFQKMAANLKIISNDNENFHY